MLPSKKDITFSKDQSTYNETEDYAYIVVVALLSACAETNNDAGNSLMHLEAVSKKSASAVTQTMPLPKADERRLEPRASIFFQKNDLQTLTDQESTWYGPGSVTILTDGSIYYSGPGIEYRIPFGSQTAVAQIQLSYYQTSDCSGLPLYPAPAYSVAQVGPHSSIKPLSANWGDNRIPSLVDIIHCVTVNHNLTVKYD